MSNTYSIILCSQLVSINRIMLMRIRCFNVNFNLQAEALCSAAYGGQVEVVRFLLDSGDEINRPRKVSLAFMFR